MDGDRITFSFDDSSTRAEASLVSVFAARQRTRAGAALSCEQLLDLSLTPEDDEVVVAQSTEVPVPGPAGQQPLLVQLPQGDYAFYARAVDRFGFVVATGCVEAELSSRRALQLEIDLRTLPAPSGRLEAVGETTLLLHAGAAALEESPGLSVLATDLSGRSQADVEVRALVEGGGAVPLAEAFRTDQDGRGHTALLVGEGTAEVLLHARGLEGSPLSFQVTGLASPSYQALGVELRPDESPVALVAGNFDFDTAVSTDLLLIVQREGEGHIRMWRSGIGGGLGYDHTFDLQTLDQPVAAAGGLYDSDDRPDLVIASAPVPPDDLPALAIHHHDDDLGDRLDALVLETLPPDPGLVVQQLLRVDVNRDAIDDLAVKVRLDGSDQVLIYIGLSRDRSSDGPFLELSQRFTVPGFVGLAELGASDLDSDGDDELLFLAPLLGIWIVPCGDAEGLGDGRYHVPTDLTTDDWPYLFANLGANLVAFADFNHDGLNDVAVVNDGTVLGTVPALRLALGTGGLFDLTLDNPRMLAIDRVHHLAVSDFNADTHPDLLMLTNNPPQRAILMGGDGAGGFASPLGVSVALDVVDVALADVNVDGVTDLCFVGRSFVGSFLQVWSSEGLTR